MSTVSDTKKKDPGMASLQVTFTRITPMVTHGSLHQDKLVKISQMQEVGTSFSSIGGKEPRGGIGGERGGFGGRGGRGGRGGKGIQGGDNPNLVPLSNNKMAAKPHPR